VSDDLDLRINALNRIDAVLERLDREDVVAVLLALVQRHRVVGGLNGVEERAFLARDPRQAFVRHPPVNVYPIA
jgi:hypothetical protein